MVVLLLRIVLRFFFFNSAQASSIRITQPNTMSHLHSKQEYYYHETSSSNYFCFQIAEMEEMFSKLNPMARDFVPHSPSPSPSSPQQLGYFNNFLLQTNNHLHTTSSSSSSTKTTRVNKPKQGGHGKKRMNTPRTSMAQRDDVIKRTVYVSNIDHQVTEQQLASLFVTCGQLVDCRICGADPKSVLRFAFIEFTTQEAATKALNLSGTMLGYYSVRVTPSKTAIAPVNPTLLPRSQDEMEMCAKTIYCTNIDKKITQTDIKLFFESLCGEVYRLRMLGDYHHSTRIAFVEFLMPESATAALNCSGAVLGSLPIRVSPSKTPVRPRANRHGKR